MKTIFTFSIVVMFTITLSASAQSIQSVQTTQVNAQQGRVILDSDVNETNENEPIACTADAKQCSDGSFVGRTAPSCEFEACPSESDGDTAGDQDQPEDGAKVFLEIKGIEGDSNRSSSEEGGDTTEGIEFTLNPDRIEASSVERLDDDSDGDGIGADEDIGGSIQTPEDTQESGFMKIGDIKGEADDSANKKGGNAETTWKVEKGEKSATKPKEIVVVGSKVREATAEGVEVRGWDPVKKEVILQIEDIETEEDLTDYAAALLASSEDVSDISVRGDEIGLTFGQEVRLLGLFPLIMEQTIDVSSNPDELGRVKVQFPWWSFLAKKDISADEIKSAVEAEIVTVEDLVIDEREMTTGDGTANDVEQTETRKFQTLSNTMKAVHDTAMAIIRKIG